jgi:hypothetical protein
MRLTRLSLLMALTAPALFGADPLPVWQTDWNTAFRMAREQHRLVFVDYVTNACKPCHDIETISFKQLEVMKRFLGHSDVKTTMIYTHVLGLGANAVRSPLDALAD